MSPPTKSKGHTTFTSSTYYSMTGKPSSYQPARNSPLIGLPSELDDDRMKLCSIETSPFSEGRPFVFHLIVQDGSLDARTIWQYIFPYRLVTPCCPSPNYTSQEVYLSILSSLESWFSKDPLTPINFSLWSISMMITIMQNLSMDFEARTVFFDAASQDIREVFRCASRQQLELLSKRLSRPAVASSMS